jgi:uncharacterized protein YbjT (DUF2867 family)
LHKFLGTLLSTPLKHSSIFGLIFSFVVNTAIAVEDIAEAASIILADPLPHRNKTYSLVGPVFTQTQVAKAFTTALGREIKYSQVPFEDFQTGLETAVPAWQAAGIVELLRMVNANKYQFKSNDFEAITHHGASPIEQWVNAVTPAFQ